MDTTNYHQTVSKNAEIKNTIKKSRFIASIKEIENEEEAKLFLKSITQKFPDATHHCWAYKYGLGKETVLQYSDGGEPANSAGPPILQAIKKEKVTNVMVVVSRYFGGNKLGISGLIQAYRESALQGLQVAGKVKKISLREFIIENIEYQTLGNILQSIESQSGRIEDIIYSKRIKIKAFLPEQYQKWITQVVKSASRGEGKVKLGKLRWYRIQ
ncbi:MAG TPA: YigZ family protein [Candidatus Atribacteria bacterium]|jgi:uncharacterized YigZ family protein|nr:YigZ family protein [Candidatus Atribacteria bacterium]